MTIRIRTDDTAQSSALRRTDDMAQSSALRRVAGASAASGLGLAAVLHAAWATGSTWPARSPDDLADLVVGRRPFPGPAMCFGVAGLLGAASGLTAADAGLVPLPERARPWVHRGANSVAVAMLARGTFGMITSATGIGRSTPVYRRWDLSLYSPLCLALGLLAATSSPRRARTTPPQPPHRSGSLPPGQRATARFPRFGDKPLRPPPPTRPVELRVSAPGLHDLVIDEAALAAMEPTEQFSDFHCVTTWSHLGIPWGGVPMRAVWDGLITPWAGTLADADFVVARGADRQRAVLVRDDLLAPDVLLALRLDGEPLDVRHGAPLRLVSPSQYGYKSVKHLVGLELRRTQPRLGSKEHLRARVDLEERHARIDGRLLRWPNRALIRPTAFLAERSLRRGEPRPAG